MHYREVSLHGHHYCAPDGAIQGDLDDREEVGEEEGVDPQIPGRPQQWHGEGEGGHKDEEGIKQCQHSDYVPEGDLDVDCWRAQYKDSGQIASQTKDCNHREEDTLKQVVQLIRHQESVAEELFVKPCSMALICPLTSLTFPVK